MSEEDQENLLIVFRTISDTFIIIQLLKHCRCKIICKKCKEYVYRAAVLLHRFYFFIFFFANKKSSDSNVRVSSVVLFPRSIKIK